MKQIVTIAILLWTLGVGAQNSDSLGIDDNPTLNENEVELLNSLLAESRGDFDFSGKKVAFIIGNTGRTIVSKSNYFKNSVVPWIEKDSVPRIFMVKLTESEKQKSGGYDVLVLSWVKVFTPKSQEKAIQYLEHI